MGRTHDFHCPNCHIWVSALDMPSGWNLACPDCRTIMFYDLNHDGCDICSDEED